MVDEVVASAMLWSDWDAGWCARGRGTGDGLVSAETALSLALGRALLTKDEAALARTLDRLYSSEINARVVLSAEGWTGELGDDWNGFGEKRSAVPLNVLVDWFSSAARRAFPESEFAR